MKFPLRSILLTSTIVSILISELASAFPDFIRKGYQGCQSCHFSPSGGGMKHQYGRMISGDTLSTWGNAGPRLTPDWLHFSGDARHVYLKTDTTETTFPMQMDLELGLEPMEGILLAGSTGWYGKDKKQEIHSLYTLFTLKYKKTYFNLRAGKFYPNYGLMIVDHTRQIKRRHLISRGQETLNVEGSIVGKHGEVTVTSIMGETDYDENLGASYKKDFRSKQGYAVKIAWYVAKKAQIGYSYIEVKEGMEKTWSQAPHISIGFFDGYILAEKDFHKKDSAEYYKLGYEFIKGLHAYGVYEGLNQPIYGLKWFPYPHLELLAEKRGDDFLAMLHYYF